MLSSNSYTSGPYTRSPTQFSSVNQPPVLQTSQVNFSPNVQRFQGSSIQSPYVHSDNLETLDHDILEMRNGLVSTKEKLKNFWTNAKRNPGYSQKCFLDARYFNNILTKEVYEGVVQEPMYIAIKEGNFTSDPNDGDRREFEAGFSFNEDAFKNSKGDIRLIRVIIEIGSEGKQSVSRHSNLIWIDTKRFNIYRFEPMHEHPYINVITEILSDYFEMKLPEYDFYLYEEFPQKTSSMKCPGQGWCSAFILMKAFMILTGKNMSFPEDTDEAEKLAMKFAYAVEYQYGIIPGEPIRVYGFFDGFSQNWFTPSKWTKAQKTAVGAGAGALAGGLFLGGWKGAILGAGIGGLGTYALTKN